jgi:lipopolysaccharide export system protein LptA
MHTSQAARYARYAAYAALLLAAVVAGVFAHRSWQARQVQKKAPPAVPPTVQQRSAEFSFSKVEQERTLFTVRASRATEFKEGNRNLLEDVWITIYGRTGQRFDNIHTQSCDYLSDTGSIVCAGEVQIDLESAEDAARRRGQPGGAAAGERIICVATTKVLFDRDSGEARTDQPVTFRFPYGEGHGVGVTYSSRTAAVRLHRDVELMLALGSAAATSGVAPEPVTLSGGSMEYRREDHVLRLSGPVHARQGRRELTAGELALELDADLNAKRLVASRQPEFRSSEPHLEAVLSADEFVAFFRPQGWTERILARGSVRGSRKGPWGEDRLEAQQLDVEMVPKQNEPREITASGNVVAQAGGGSRRLETAALRAFFAPLAKPGERRLSHAETLAPATLELQTPGATARKAEPEITRLRGQQMAAEFDERNRMRNLTARNGVEVERRLAGRPPQTTTSRELAAKFGPGGDWTEVVQTGNVRLREADRIAQADRARYDRATDNVTLTGSALVADPSTRTTAQSVSFNQRSGEALAQGDVRSTDISPGRSGINLAPLLAHISSDRLLANSSTGRAVYSGRARLWQGDAEIEADSIELVRDARLLNARGNVMAAFPQAAGSPTSGLQAGSPGKSQSPSVATGPDLWRVRAGTLTYWSGEGRARLEQNVAAESHQAQISSRALDLFFSSSGSSVGSPVGVGSGGTQQLTRAVATGNVVVRQGDRRGTAERADYFAGEGKFVLSGGRPTLYDASRGTTVGRQLTFFFADDTIVVDSEQGSRTLTKHRVEK